ncbi:hypothetical protein [Nocardia panacis]|uniref:hypothetical protein n=1 Tax=Nocardia panacis TaxID=2340916 RepID=UPI0019398993|nr:hypothetical protein [Nocardia panacis]
MNDGERGRSRGARWAPAGYSALLAGIVLGPLGRPGYLLLRDAVSTPRSYLTDSALGLGDAAPRAVPQDAALAVISTAVDGGVVVKVVLFGALWLAGWGAAALVRELLRVSIGPQLVASTLGIWNPYIAERLLQGHWSLLTGYAALPWITLSAYRIRLGTEEPLRAWAILGGCFAAAGLTPTGAILGGCVALILIGRRNLIGAFALLAAACAPWLMATALSGAGADPSDPTGIAAFAARAEPGLGTLGSLAGLGGIWNADAVPASRTTIFAVVATALLLLTVGSGLRSLAFPGSRVSTAALGRFRSARQHLDTGELRGAAHLWIRRRSCGEAATGTNEPAPGSSAVSESSRIPLRSSPGKADEEPAHGLFRQRQRGRAAAALEATSRQDLDLAYVYRALLILAAIAILLPALGAAPWGRQVLEWLVANIPGTGLLRDTQKYVALALPAYVLCAAAGADALTRRRTAFGARTRQFSRMISAVFATLLILPLLDLAWGALGAIHSVTYPRDWSQVAEKIDGPGDIAVLPGGMFRKFYYSGSAPVLDPAPRMLPRDVLQTGELPVRGHTVTGEGTRAREVETALLQGDSPTHLARLGVGWVLVEHTTPGPLGASANTLAQLPTVYSGPTLTLYQVPAPVERPSAPTTHRYFAYAAHLLWAALLVLAAIAAISLRRPPMP